MIGGSGWQATNDSTAIQKQFEFADFKMTSNFLYRYSKYCMKVGQTPTWSNTYNTVTVTINNPGFTEVSKREVDLAKYLDMLSTVQVTDYHNIDQQLSFPQVVDIGNIMVERAVNDQVNRTTLYWND